LPDTQKLLSANESLANRPHPEMLQPGERLVIPDLEPMKHSLATGRRHKLVVPVPKCKLRVTFLSSGRKPVSATSAEVIPERGPEENVELTSGGFETSISPLCGTAQVKVAASETAPQEVEWVLHLGHLPRIESDAGAFARLRNLGYYRKVTDEDDARERRSALEEFQHDQNLPMSGKLDDKTRAKIEEIYGC
jgi:N-acetylmuramoyl-L-alanine amidase